MHCSQFAPCSLSLPGSTFGFGSHTTDTKRSQELWFEMAEESQYDSNKARGRFPHHLPPPTSTARYSMPHLYLLAKA